MAIDRQLSVLNIGGHPKDVVLYAGGTMALHVEQGDRVVGLTPTYGLSHHETAVAAYKRGEQVDIEALERERMQELTEACAELGVTDVRCLGYDDDVPMVERRIVEDIADVICEVKPDFIVTHHPGDTVIMHAVTGEMTLIAVETAATIRLGKLPPHSVKQVFFHTQIGRTTLTEQDNPRIPSVVIDITSTVTKKAMAMNRFTSQHYGPDSPLQRKLGEAIDASIAGIHRRVPYAETFVPLHANVYRSLPFSDYEFEIADRSGEENLAYMTQMLLDDFKPAEKT
jgi:LmbE family N-acetylglucosaminyl deacetylase